MNKNYNEEQRKQALKDMLQQLQAGATLEEVQPQFQQMFGSVSAAEISAAEQALMQEGVSAEEIQRLCDVHAAVFEGSIEEIHAEQAVHQQPGHPAYVFLQENQGAQNLINQELRPALARWRQGQPQAKEDLLLALHRLGALDKHYKRKENLLFPYLEKAGIEGPPKVMWGVDDEIRQGLKELTAGVQAAQEWEAPLQTRLTALLEQIEAMFFKEESILLPMLVDVVEEKDWVTITKESGQIGYAFTGGIEGASPSDAAHWAGQQKAQPPSGQQEPAALEGAIKLPSGQLRLEELTALLNTLPVDITFVGADGRVRFFSENKDRIFPRTRTIIGRDVANCHPPQSLHVVEQLMRDLESGARDSESFWFRLGPRFILIRYYAVRDAQGKYLGVLEVSEDIAPIQELQGSKKLMS